jgi:hypothetical protein
MADKSPENPRGAGRKTIDDPALKRRMLAIKLPGWLIDKLKAEPGSQSRLIERALIKFFNWSRK